MVSMTGKDLIIYILKNNLENEIILADGIFMGMMSAEEAAVKFNVGVSTVEAWYKLGMLPGFMFGGSLYFMKDVTDPSIKNNQGVDCNG